MWQSWRMTHSTELVVSIQNVCVCFWAVFSAIYFLVSLSRLFDNLQCSSASFRYTYWEFTYWQSMIAVVDIILRFIFDLMEKPCEERRACPAWKQSCEILKSTLFETAFHPHLISCNFMIFSFFMSLFFIVNSCLLVNATSLSSFRRKQNAVISAF